MIEKLQTNYKEKLVASRDDIIERINSFQKAIETQTSKDRSELGKMVQESHDVQNKQLDSLKKDTET